MMSNRAGVLNIDVGEKTKQEASRILDEMGMNMTTAVKVFLNQVVVENGLPFQPCTKNALFTRNMETARKAVADEAWSDEEILADVMAVRYGS
jgi:DNA-damage-inducible protein J